MALKLLYSNYHILNFKMRRKLCESLVVSHLNYCLIIYYPCLDQKTKSRLQKIQNFCCRFILKLRKYDHISTKINELRWLFVENIFQYQLSVFAFKINQHILDENLNFAEAYMTLTFGMFITCQ
jgi:hypothetical protein